MSSCPQKHYVQIALRESLWQNLYKWSPYDMDIPRMRDGMRMRFLEGINLWQFCLKKKSLFSTDIGMGDCKTELVLMKLTFFFDQRWMRTISCLQTVFIGKKRLTNKFYQTFIYLFLSLSLLQLAIYSTLERCNTLIFSQTTILAYNPYLPSQPNSTQ